MMKDYLNDSRAPRYSVLMALPLLLLYEGLSFALNGSSYAGVRNGADVILKSAFLSLAGTRGLLVFELILLGAGAFLVWRDRRANRGPLVGRTFVLMMMESAVYAVLFGLVVGKLTALVLGVPARLQIGGGKLDLPTQLVTSLGAGIYEELLFRFLLTGGLVKLFMTLSSAGRTSASAAAVVLSALIFSGFHYVGSLGDTFTLQSFVFRAIAGLVFSGLFVTRGIGITAWTHALYDVMLTVVQQ